MSLQRSERVKRVKPSATIAVSMKAAELKAQGRDILSLSMGEPDFDTPDHVKEAAIQAIRDGQTKYTAVDGTPELKDAIAGKLKRDNGFDYSAGQILASNGAKHSIYNLMVALLNHGDEVIVPAPYWVSYPDMARLVDAEPVILETGPQQQFKLTPEQLEAAITDRTRLLMLNSPSNPTGMAYTKAEFAALGEVLAKHPDIVVCSDEIYEHIWWANEPFCSPLHASPDLAGRTVLVNGVSKAYAMTGWRIGFAAGPEELITEMKKVQGQSTSNPSSISQAAAAAALGGDQSPVAPMVRAFRERHDYIVEALDGLPGVECLPGQGAFYAFPSMRGAIQAIDGVDDDVQLAEHLLEQAGVALVPGSAFGGPGHLRVSFAAGMDTLEEAVRRLGDALG